jgi:hypothetical protein
MKDNVVNLKIFVINSVLGIRIRIQIRKDPNVLKDPNQIKLFGFGSERIRTQIL